MVLGKPDIPYRRLKLDPSLSPCASMNSKWIKDLSVRSEMVKLLQEEIGTTLDHISTAITLRIDPH
jgi:hypothetical protein